MRVLLEIGRLFADKAYNKFGVDPLVNGLGGVDLVDTRGFGWIGGVFVLGTRSFGWIVEVFCFLGILGMRRG